MTGIIIAIISALFTATMIILVKKSYKELNPSVTFFFDSIFALFVWIPVGIIFGGKIADIPQNLVYALISAILSEAYVFYAMSKGNLGVTSTLIATYPIYTLLFSFLINKEILTGYQLTFIIITILGTVLACVEEEIKLKSFKNKKVLIPISAAMAIGIADTLAKKAINATSSYTFLIAMAIAQVPIALIYLKTSKQTFKGISEGMKKEKKLYRYGIIGSLLAILGTGLLYISFNYSYASIASPLTAIYTPIVLLYACIFMKEKLRKVNTIGIILTFIGTFGILFLGG